MLGEIGALFTPDTILRWHRELVAQHHTHERHSPGRPPIDQAIVLLAIRFAKETPKWGCDRIQGELKKLGYELSDTTIENILKRNGIEPAPIRGESSGSWAEFLKAHWETLAATDFTTVDVWTPTGLRTIYLFFVMELRSRRVQFVGSTEHPNEEWMLDAVQRATAPNAILGGTDHPTVLIMDRDTKFSKAFKEKLKQKGVEPKKTAIRAPNMNAFQERFMLSYKSEMAWRLIFFGKAILDRATAIYLEHYHEERPHQGLDNQLIIPLSEPPDVSAPIETTKRLGGMLKSYRRAAA